MHLGIRSGVTPQLLHVAPEDSGWVSPPVKWGSFWEKPPKIKGDKKASRGERKAGVMVWGPKLPGAPKWPQEHWPQVSSNSRCLKAVVF